MARVMTLALTGIVGIYGAARAGAGDAASANDPVALDPLAAHNVP
jgi:hypothetical protein